MGCYHRCIYCYARLYTRDRRAAERWGEVVLVKRNLIQLLEMEVSRTRKGVVGIGTITDAYQPAEATYRLTRKSLQILLPKGFRVSIQTKNPLVLRDLDILSSFKGSVDVGFTITTINGKISSFIEPCAPHPSSRAEALREVSDAGVKTWIFYGPMIPGINDRTEDVEDLLKLAAETGSVLYFDPLHVKPFMLSSDHPLHDVAYSGRISSQLSGTIRYLKRRCEEEGIECRGGFEVT
ncbi:MAG: SPL family radical SAM protein [Fervidicoccaceae archaeon]|jgi:DNA repair photolyase